LEVSLDTEVIREGRRLMLTKEEQTRLRELENITPEHRSQTQKVELEFLRRKKNAGDIFTFVSRDKTMPE